MSVFSCDITRLQKLIVTALRISHMNFKLTNVNLFFAIYSRSQSMPSDCRYAPHNDVSVIDGPHNDGGPISL
jgi:hypothetical protein